MKMKYILIAVFWLACKTPTQYGDRNHPYEIEFLPRIDSVRLSEKPKVVFINYGHNLLWDTCGRYIKYSRKDYEKMLDTSIWTRTNYYSNCKGLINPKDW